jgi:nitroimidazol reductase NimA-like FMN-containing flavoprotein (pyridoxamine 5'-phosphate oxidase superfamily)
VGRLATARDNKPHVVPVRYAFKSGKIYIDTARDSKKTRNIIKNNRVAFVVDDYATLDGVKRARGVLIEGQAEILESGKNYELGRKLIREKYSSVKGYQKGFCKDRVIIVINPNEISGWGL